jgi:hypothetical protein
MNPYQDDPCRRELVHMLGQINAERQKTTKRADCIRNGYAHEYPQHGRACVRCGQDKEK